MTETKADNVLDINQDTVRTTEALEKLQEPFEVNVDGRVYVLTDFINQWNIPQANAFLRILRHCLKDVDTADQGAALLAIIGNLAEQDLTQEALSILFIPKGQARWNSAKYKDYITDMEQLTPGEAIEAFSRFFSSVDLSQAGISLTR